MSTETEIQSEVESLKARFSDTKALYREVCALLFFRHGITPTASKLYQYARRGSMSAPADALAKFWEELRAKARIEIDHPDLPEGLKVAAADAIAEIWRQASAAARAELAEVRIEARAEVTRAETDLASCRRASEESAVQAEALRQEIRRLEELARSTSTELEAERRVHAGTAARMLELQRHHDELIGRQDTMRAAFSADLAKAQGAVEGANARADAAERRALLEIDESRQSRAKAEKQLEALRGQAARESSRHRDVELEQADALGRVRAQFETAQESTRTLSTERLQLSEQLDAVSRELAEARQVATAARAEAETMRSMLERIPPASPAEAVSPPAKPIIKPPRRKS
jgi:chromosome segregation ATPase